MVAGPRDGADYDSKAVDPLEARDLYPLLRRHIFMNHAGVAPMSERARAAVHQVMEELSARPYPDNWAREEADRLRERLARIFGVRGGCIALTRGTAHGLSLLAQGLDWRQGDNVVGAEGEYPANVYPWMALQGRGVEYRMARCVDGRVTPEAVLELVDGRTRVVALSQVEFWNGYRVDIAAIGEECRRRGVIMAVDVIQSAGALRVDLDGLNADFAAAGAYKWLLGPIGIGFCYIQPELLERLQPALVGAGSVKNYRDFFHYDLKFALNSRRFEESSVSLLDIAAFAAAADLIQEVGIERIERRVLDLGARLASGLAERGYELLPPWPRGSEESSGIVSFRKPGASPQEPMRDLTAAGVVGRVHADFVRLSPHFYNTEEEVDRVLSVLAPEHELRS